MRRLASLLLALLLGIGALAACEREAGDFAGSGSQAPLLPRFEQPACAPNDQDRYVYDPTRLDALQACTRVSGVVETVENDVDGDLVIHLRLDAVYRVLLRPANFTEEHGDLVVEAVCVHQPVQPNAVLLCDADPNPYAGPFPQPGAHVWMEGRYVLDGHHEGHPELHPLYRAGGLPS